MTGWWRHRRSPRRLPTTPTAPVWPTTAPRQALQTSQRTAIALMGFGFVVERFGLFLRLVSKQTRSPSRQGFSLWLGVCLRAIGASLSVVSALQVRTVERGLGDKEIPRGSWTNQDVWLTFLLAAVALAVHFVSSG